MILWMNECAAVRFKEEFDRGRAPHKPLETRW
jgi:hypothetical protein